MISNMVSSGIVIFILMHETEPIRLDLKKLAVDTHELKRILKIGIPAGLNFEFFAYFMVNAFAQATVTFTSQNYGAGEYESMKDAEACCHYGFWFLCAAADLDCHSL